MAFEAKQKSIGLLQACVALGPNKSYTADDLGCFIMEIFTISCTGEWINGEYELVLRRDEAHKI